MAHRVSFVDPAWVIKNAGNPPEFDLVERKCLAQGDSWFSIGSIPPGVTSNILAQLELTRSAAVVNCARPGKLLRRMGDTTSEPTFRQLLTGKFADDWDAILLSGGGNDLIEAAGVAPTADASVRLLRTVLERDAAPATGDDYINDPGWATFETYLSGSFQIFLDLKEAGINKSKPLVLHTYCPIMPRPSPAGPGIGPWLQKAMVAYQVPPDRWLDVMTALIDRLAVLLGRLAATPGATPIRLVDSRNAGLVLGDQHDEGASGDFQNEIHPTRAVYTKLAATWRPVVDDVLQ